MRKLTKIILPEVGVGDLKIRPRGDNRCESANKMNLFLKHPSAADQYRATSQNASYASL